MEKSNKGALPKDHWERKESQAPVCGEKYASRSTMENPRDIEKQASELAAYARKNKMKY